MIVIGELINGTRKAIREAIQDHDTTTIYNIIKAQDKAGAHYIDLNAGTGSGDLELEKKDLCWLIDCALDCSEKKIALDSADAAVLHGAVEYLDNRREWMINSIKGDNSDTMKQGLALAAAHNMPIVALAMGKEGIPRSVEERINLCELLFNASQKAGLDSANLFFDPIVMPISADITQGKVTFKTIEEIHKRFDNAKTTMGLSNISHGLKKRAQINAAFLMMSIGFGLDSAICDITRPEISQAVLLSEVLAGNDRHCRRFTRAIRQGVFDDKGE